MVANQLRTYQLLLMEQILKARDVRTPMVVGLQRGRASGVVDDHNFFPVVEGPRDYMKIHQMASRVVRVGRITPRPSIHYIDFVNDMTPDALPPNRIVSPDLYLTDEALWLRRLQPYRGSKASLFASMEFASIYNFGRRYGKRQFPFCEYLRHPLDDLVNHRDPYSNFPSPDCPPSGHDPHHWSYSPAWYYERVARERPPLDQTSVAHPHNAIPGAHRVS